MTDAYFKEIEDRGCTSASRRRKTSSPRSAPAAPSPALLDRIVVEAYGQPVPLKQVAGVSTPDSRTLLISCLGQEHRCRPIRKADREERPRPDAQRRRQRRSGCSIPPLNEERRKDLAKLVKKKAEDGRVAVRNVRHKAHDEIKVQFKSGRYYGRRQQAHARIVAEVHRQVRQGDRRAGRRQRKRDHGSVTEDLVLVPEVQARRALREIGASGYGFSLLPARGSAAARFASFA